MNKHPALGDRTLLLETFRDQGWRVSLVAKSLGISRQGIYDAARRLGITIPELTADQKSANARHAIGVRWQKHWAKNPG